MTNKKSLIDQTLDQFTDTEAWYRHPLNRTVFYTDGARDLARYGNAYWLLDRIAIEQQNNAVAAEEFQVWTLKVNPGSTALLVCDDGNGRIIYEQSLPVSDFPWPETKLYCCDRVIMLPCEF